jgi:hypothetical protein
LFHIGANHLKKVPRLLTNFIDQFKGFCYGDFHLHGASPFWVVLVDFFIKEKRLFFELLQFHTIKNTLPMQRMRPTGFLLPKCMHLSKIGTRSAVDIMLDIGHTHLKRGRLDAGRRAGF